MAEHCDGKLETRSRVTLDNKSVGEEEACSDVGYALRVPFSPLTQGNGEMADWGKDVLGDCSL